jgi:hypothetical protein
MSRTKLRTPEQEQAAFCDLSTAVVAARLGCTPDHVIHLIGPGPGTRLRAIDIGAGVRPEYRVKEEWLAEFMAAREVRADAA